MSLKQIVKDILGEKITTLITKRFRPQPVHIKNIFGFDLYQNNLDTINYAKWSELSIDNIRDDADGKVIKFIKENIKFGDTVLDIGANIGLMTLVLGKSVGKNGKVYSFEPGPISHSLLARNIFANIDKTGAIVFFNNAMTDLNGPVELFINSDGESDNQVHRGTSEYIFLNEQSRKKVIVEGITLDSFISTIDSSKVTFIKMDTQGHEYYILQGGKNFLKLATNLTLYIEYAPYLKSWENHTQDDFYNLIKELGFKIFDSNNMQHGEVDKKYLNDHYSYNFIGKYTDLILVKWVIYQLDLAHGKRTC